MIAYRLFLAMTAASLLTMRAEAQESDRLIGIWGAKLRFGPTLHGALMLRQDKGAWTASIAGRKASFVLHGDSGRADFGAEGSFRGQMVKGAVHGFWVQPAVRLGNSPDPGAVSPSYATPLVLKNVGPSAWRGTVVPLDSKFTLWLSIFPAPDGSLLAAFRNPEFNLNGGASRFDVAQSGAAIHFSMKTDGGEITHAATFFRHPDRIRLESSELGQSIDLTRQGAEESTAFFPRAPGSEPYIYRRPPQLDDGWRTARAAATGIDEKALEAAVREIAAADPTARPPQLMHSILVAHHGKLVLEEYFYGFDRATPHDTRSAAKTFASVMLGTAPARAAGLSPDSHIYDVLGSLAPFVNTDPRKARITLSHLLTHTSGLACNDNNDASPGNEGTMQTQAAEPNWWRYTLNLPQAFDPATRYAYCSANSNLVGAALTEATHIWLPELFRRTIAEPLQFGEWHWNLMPNGEGYAGGGAYLLPRDFLKVGQTYLDGGLWNGRRIVAQQWVRESTRARVSITPETTGLTEDEFSNFYWRGEDGLAWHLGNLTSGAHTFRTYAATGNGGQILLVVPEADLVVVFTGGNYGQGGVWNRWDQQIVGDKIIPAVRQP